MTRMNGHPVSLAVIVSVCFVVGLLVIAGAITGCYLLWLHAQHVQAAQDAALRAREATSQLRASIPTCRALLGMDNARTSLKAVNHPAPYVRHLARAIHRVYKSTRCQVILNGLARHLSFPQILKQLGG